MSENVDPNQAIVDHFAAVRSDAVKAVEEAVKAEAPAEAAPADDPEAPDEPAAAAPDGEEAPAETPAPAEDDRSIARILKQREQAAKAKTDAQRALEEARTAAEEAKKAREDLARERDELAREKAKLAKLKDVRNAPDALRELGWDPDDFIAEAARANTPEGKMAALIRSQQEELAALKAKADAWERQSEEAKTSAQRQADEAQIKMVEKAFVDTATNAEKYPALAALYDDDHDTLLYKAHNIARQYRAATGGDEATFEQIAEYLNGLAEQKLTRKQGSAKAGTAQPAGRPTGKRTITGADSSERRSVGAVDKTDDLDEMRRRARQAAEKAIRESA